MEVAASPCIESSLGAGCTDDPAGPLREADEPPWVAPKFDVKKKPRPVPKPRYVIGKPPACSPSVDEAIDASTLASDDPPATSPLQARPRWGQLEERTHYSAHGLHDAVSEDCGADPLTHVCTNAVGLTLLDATEPRKATSSTARSPSGVKPAAHDYKATWQRWRAIPPSLEEKLQDLLRPPPQPPRQAQPPTKEALDFLETLLSGTEPSAESMERKDKIFLGGGGTLPPADYAHRSRYPAAPRPKRAGSAEGSSPRVEPIGRSPCASNDAERCHGAPSSLPRRAQNVRNDARPCAPLIQSSAVKTDVEGQMASTAQAPGASSEDRGLRPQALGRRVQNHVQPAANSSEKVAEGAAQSHQQRPKASGSPKASSAESSSVPDDDFQQRMRDKEDEHKRRLRELEEEMERDRQQLLKEMEREQQEHSSRRRAQDEWKEKELHKTERRRQEAERFARERDNAQSQSDEVWRKRWWQNWQRSETEARRKMEEQKEWSKDWWKTWQEKPEEEEFFFDDDEPTWAYQGPTPETRPDPSARRQAGNTQPKPAGAPGWTATPSRLPPPPPKEAAAAATVVQAQVLEQLIVYRRECLEERKRTWRQMCLQWHPDKCGDKAGATAMFQFLQGLKDWFLAEK